MSGRLCRNAFGVLFLGKVGGLFWANTAEEASKNVATTAQPVDGRSGNRHENLDWQYTAFPRLAFLGLFIPKVLRIFCHNLHSTVERNLIIRRTYIVRHNQRFCHNR